MRTVRANSVMRNLFDSLLTMATVLSSMATTDSECFNNFRNFSFSNFEIQLRGKGNAPMHN